jgi:hypothetical protein
MTIEQAKQILEDIKTNPSAHPSQVVIQALQLVANNLRGNN